MSYEALIRKINDPNAERKAGGASEFAQRMRIESIFSGLRTPDGHRRADLEEKAEDEIVVLDRMGDKNQAIGYAERYRKIIGE